MVYFFYLLLCLFTCLSIFFVHLLFLIHFFIDSSFQYGMDNEDDSQIGLQSKDCYAIGLGPHRHLSAQGRGMGGL